jgi:2'-5' RNA ligase
MMRLFTAIELTDEARDAVAHAQQRIRTDFGDLVSSLRFVRPEHLHVTLIFIGETPDETAAAIVETMRQDLDQPSFQLHLGGIGIFPPRKRPRVLWLGALAGANECVALHAAVAARLAKAGVSIDPRPFRPHLTLARWREGRHAGRPRLSEPSGVVARVDVRSVTLFQSRPTPDGPAYTALARARLR